MTEYGAHLSNLSREQRRPLGGHRRRSAFILPLAASICAACELAFVSDRARMQGVWESLLSDGRVIVAIVDGDSAVLTGGTNDLTVYRLELRPNETPRKIDLTMRATPGTTAPGRLEGIYDLSDDRLKVAIGPLLEPTRPTAFTAENTWHFERKGQASEVSSKRNDYLKGVATWNYWMGLRETLEQDDGTQFSSAKTPAEFADACKRGAEDVRKARSRIQMLPVANVDAEVISYASASLRALAELESQMQDFVTIIGEAQKLSIARTSDDVVAMSIVDHLVGRSGATLDAFDKEAQAIQARAAAVQSRMQTSRTELSGLESQQLTLRASLTERYGRNFPQLDP